MVMQFAEGPYLSAALLCERVLEEKDGVKSVIRIIDRVIRSIASPNPPTEMEPFDYSLTLFLRFKAGRARGTMPLKIEFIKPSGEKLPPIIHTILFEGEEDRGIDIAGTMTIKFDQTGIYWIYIYLNDVRLTQIPFRVIYMPQILPSQPSSGRLPPGQGPSG